MPSHHSPGDRNRLTLAAGETPDCRCQVVEFHADIHGDPGCDRQRGAAIDQPQRAEPESERLLPEQDVRDGVQVVAERQILEHRLDTGLAGPLRRQMVLEMLTDPELAGIRFLDSGEDLHERALAGAVLSDEARHLTRLEAEGHVVQSADRAEVLRHALATNDGVPTLDRDS